MKTKWKNLTLILLIVFEFGESASAQYLDSEPLPDTALSRSVTYHRREEATESFVSLQPIFGMNSSSITGGSGNYSFNASTGYQAGMGILLGSSTGFQFETGLLYSEHSGTELYNNQSSTYYATKWQMNYKLKYLDVPLVARYNFRIARKISMFVKGGLDVALLQDASGTVSNTQNYNPYAYNSYYNNTLNSSSVKDYFSSTNTSWVAGVGVSVHITRMISWLMEADYQAGLSKLSSTQPNGSVGTTAMSLYMNSYGLSTGLGFDL